METGRRRREETTTQLRKAKKDDQLMKRRQMAPAIPNNNGTFSTISDDGNYNYNNGKTNNNTSYTVKNIPILMGLLKSGTRDEILEGAQGFRKLLSVEHNPPANEVIAAGAMTLLLSYLNQQTDPEILFESLWALTNIASTDRTRDVANAGAIGPVVQLLVHEEGKVREQAAWCLGNIAGDSHDLRDRVLEAGALRGL